MGSLLLEGLVRVWLTFGPTPADSAYIPDAQCGYRLRPESPEVRRLHPDEAINSFGFRDVEHPVHKPPHTWRVLGLGDSFVYGSVQPHDNFLQVCERRLATLGAADSSRPEMVMMGIGGYSPENELGVLRSIGLRLDPDAVVLCFFVGNDVTGIPLRGKVLQGRVYYTGALEPVHDLLRHSYAFCALELLVAARFRAKFVEAMAPQAHSSGAPSPRDSTVAGPPFPPLSPMYIDFETRRLPVYLRRPGSRMSHLWNEAEGYLAAFDRTCKAARVPWVLLVIPEEVQVDPDVRAGVLRALHLPESAYDFDLPQRRLRAFATAHRVLLLDPLPRMRAEHRPRARLYLPNDTHWNERGNRLAGEMLGDVLALLRTPSRPDRARGTAGEGGAGSEVGGDARHHVAAGPIP